MYDLIGDIHGHADRLETLLQRMGYRKGPDGYAHPERKALFLGDYVDRGPQITETLRIVREMTLSGQALALMGNHEYNALCFHYPDPRGGHLRPHLIRNIAQHYETLRQFQGRQRDYEHYLEWFLTLPLFLETETFRAVHACWNGDQIRYLQGHLADDRLNPTLLEESVRRDGRLYHAIEETLKGREIPLPEGRTFTDNDGTVRTETRIRWWEDPRTMTYRNISIPPLEALPDEPVDLPDMSYYGESEKPVFFGHYWLKGQPEPFRHNVCCLDYSVAAGGSLVAYRSQGDPTVDPAHLVVC